MYQNALSQICLEWVIITTTASKMSIRTKLLLNLSLAAVTLFSLLASSKMWGINHLQFLQVEEVLTFVFGAFLLINIPDAVVRQISQFAFGKSQRGISATAFFGALVYGIIVWTFPVAADIYGDSYKYEPVVNRIISDSSDSWNLLLNLSLDAWAGQNTYRALVQLVSYYLQVDGSASFRILGCLFAVLFSFVWIRFVLSEIENQFLRLTLIVIGLFSPYTLVFFGRLEVYSLPIFTNLIWAIVIVKVARKEQIRPLHLLVLFSVFLINLKAHPIGLLTLPASTLIAFSGSRILRNLSAQRSIALITIPVFIVGILVYFFILEDHIDDRSLSTTAMQYDHLFLPLVSPSPPLDNYNLFSFNHIIDFANLLLLCSPGLFVLFSVSLRFKSLQFQHTALLSTILLYAALLFVINPLLTMPIDWDLYTSIVPLALVFVCTVQIPKPQFVPRFALAFTVLMMSFFPIHQSTASTSKRLLSITKHVYGTYYAWTGILTKKAMKLHSWSDPEYITLYEEHIERLSQASINGVNDQLAEVIKEFGKWYLREKNQPVKAERQFREALVVDPMCWNAQLLLTEALYEQQRFEEAYQSAASLKRFGRDDQRKKVLLMMIDCARQANLREQALLSAKELYQFQRTSEHLQILEDLGQ